MDTLDLGAPGCNSDSRRRVDADAGADSHGLDSGNAVKLGEKDIIQSEINAQVAIIVFFSAQVFKLRAICSPGSSKLFHH